MNFIKYSAILILLFFTNSVLYAQNIVGVSFVNTYTFIDSSGNKTEGGETMRNITFADSHREIILVKELNKKEMMLKRYQRGKFRHHTMIYDYDSLAIYELANYEKATTGLHKRDFVTHNDWKIEESNKAILGYKTKLASRVEVNGNIHRIYFTTDLSQYKLRFGKVEMPGFVLRTEQESELGNGTGINVFEAKSIDFYEGNLRFPDTYQIK